MKRVKRFCSFLLCGIMLFGTLLVTGCKTQQNDIKPSQNYQIQQEKYLFGVGNLTSEQLPGIIDSGVTNSWSADKMGALGVKSTRLWIYVGYYLKRSANSNEIVYLESNCKILQDYIDKMKAQGVERFIGMVCNFITPYEFCSNDSTAIPSVEDDYDIYVKFLDMVETYYGMLAKKFPDIEFWEVTNEPDIYHGSWFHKKGYISNATTVANAPYIFTAEESSYITADLCWYASKGIKAANPNLKIVLPGLVCDDTTPSYLGKIYSYIRSGYLPTAEEYSDKNEDNYFDILAWHPYPSVKSGNADGFVQLQKDIYQVAKDNGDDGKPVFYTEFGFSEGDYPPDSQNRIAEDMVTCLTEIKKQLPFVETAFVFRLSNIYEYARDDAGSRENTFGLFYSPNDPENGSKAKPVAKALKKFFYGENADLSVLDVHSKNQ